MLLNGIPNARDGVTVAVLGVVALSLAASRGGATSTFFFLSTLQSICQILKSPTKNDNELLLTGDRSQNSRGAFCCSGN